MPQEERDYTEMIKVLQPLGFGMTSNPGKFLHFYSNRMYDFSATSIDNIAEYIFEIGKRAGREDCQLKIKEALGIDQ